MPHAFPCSLTYKVSQIADQSAQHNVAAKARKHRTYRDVGALFQRVFVPQPFPDKLPDGPFLVHAESSGPLLSKVYLHVARWSDCLK